MDIEPDEEWVKSLQDEGRAYQERDEDADVDESGELSSRATTCPEREDCRLDCFEGRHTHSNGCSIREVLRDVMEDVYLGLVMKEVVKEVIREVVRGLIWVARREVIQDVY